MNVRKIRKKTNVDRLAELWVEWNMGRVSDLLALPKKEEGMTEERLRKVIEH